VLLLLLLLLLQCQRFDGEEGSFENGVFFGNVGHLTFKGPMLLDGVRPGAGSKGQRCQLCLGRPCRGR
jgi:hypothetical protein